MSVRSIEAEVSIKSGVQAECTIGREVIVEVHEEVNLESLTATANGLSYFYDRASKAVANDSFVSVALTLQDERGTVIKNECFDTAEYTEVN